jgi:hypothetical protein
MKVALISDSLLLKKRKSCMSQRVNKTSPSGKYSFIGPEKEIYRSYYNNKTNSSL